MAEWTYVGGTQIVQPGDAIIFNQVITPCDYDLILHRLDSGDFFAKGVSMKPERRTCCCKRSKAVNYNVHFGANVAIPEGGTVAPMTSTPDAVAEFNNIARYTSVPIWKGCCQSVSVRNIGTAPIEVSEPVFNMNQ